MSKLLKFLFLVILMGGIGGFIYLAVTDIPVEQKTVITETTLDALKQKVQSDE